MLVYTNFSGNENHYQYYKKEDEMMPLSMVKKGEPNVIKKVGGKEIAEMIYERHELLSLWLEKLGVPPKIAADDACKIEHVISKESFKAIKNHIK